MKNICLFIMGSALVAGSVTSAPSGNASPEKGLENYDIRSDQANDGAGTVADYRRQAAAQLLATGRSELSSQIAGLQVEDNQLAMPRKKNRPPKMKQMAS